MSKNALAEDTFENDDVGDHVIALTTKKVTDPLVTANLALSRQDYENRLASFHCSTYSSKPACLSPLICARFGWRNADRDIVSCVSCRKALAVTFPRGLSMKASGSICTAYRARVATAHANTCIFRVEADQFLQQSMDDPKNINATVPAAFASVFPPLTMEILDSPHPCKILKRVIETMTMLCPPNWSCPQLCVAEELHIFHLDDENSYSRGFSELLQSIAPHVGATNESILVLAILGWTPTGVCNTADAESTGGPFALFVCPLCLSTMEIKLAHNSETTNEIVGRNSKRQRKLARYIDPHDAHRHYCPFRCGFPTTMTSGGTPLWKALLTRLDSDQRKWRQHRVDQDTNSEEVLDQGTAITRIRRILLSGIVSKNNSQLAVEEEVATDSSL